MSFNHEIRTDKPKPKKKEVGLSNPREMALELDKNKFKSIVEEE